ncbi:MAG: DUF1847 domain-containing protein [Dehalococcoidia bacterium]|nr:DUF1847 domain-containing protein [Dehalococcoidia bacterium]
MDYEVECTKCTKVVCTTRHFDKGADTCPTKTRAEIIKKTLPKYSQPDIKEFARQASIQETQCFMKLPGGMTMVNPRVEETAQFAEKMGYKRIGIAFCGGLREEAKILTKILENRGFQVISVCCKVGGIPKETIGLKEEDKITPGDWETMCNPITQAEILNNEETEFNILVGLCVGHDALFLKHVKAPTTVLIAKDRVLCHNPAAGLYLSSGYYRRLMHRGAGYP